MKVWGLVNSKLILVDSGSTHLQKGYDARLIETSPLRVLVAKGQRI